MFNIILVEAEDGKDGCILMMWGGPAVEKFMKGCIPWEIFHIEEKRKSVKEEAAEEAKC